MRMTPVLSPPLAAGRLRLTDRAFRLAERRRLTLGLPLALLQQLPQPLHLRLQLHHLALQPLILALEAIILAPEALILTPQLVVGRLHDVPSLGTRFPDPWQIVRSTTLVGKTR
jgi:hypothetical protein